MRRVVYIVLGLLALAVCFGALAAGVGVVWFFGTDGRFESSTGTITGSSSALVSEPATLEEAAPVEFGVGTLTVVVEPVATGRPVFIGVGPTPEVDAYLLGTTHDVITSVENDPLRVELLPVAGFGAPRDPTGEPFWDVQTVGEGPQRLDWDLQDGSFRLVIANPDGAVPLDVRAKVELYLPWIFPVGVVAFAVGLVAFLVAIALFSSSGTTPPGKRRITVPKNVAPQGPLPTPLGGPKGPTP